MHPKFLLPALVVLPASPLFGRDSVMKAAIMKSMNETMTPLK